MKFDGYMICSDFDGTLAYGDGQISSKNLDAIHYFQQNGGVFTLASGRSPEFVQQLAPDFIANGPLICLNGTRICDPDNGKILYQSFLPPSAVDVIKYLYANDSLKSIQPVVEDDGKRFYLNKPEFSLQQIIDTVGASRIHKVLFVFDNADTALSLRSELNEKFGEKIQFCRSWAFSVEMYDKPAGKGECLELARSMAARPIYTVIGVGDYENDISLVRLADVGYAVENAIDSVKAAADKIAPSNINDAIADIIYSL